MLDFTDKPIKIDEIDLTMMGYEKIYIYKSFSNATVNESIQIRTSGDSVNSKMVFENYDTLLLRKIIKNQLVLILMDTGGKRSQIDTFHIHLDSIFIK